MYFVQLLVVFKILELVKEAILNFGLFELVSFHAPRHTKVFLKGGLVVR